MQVVPQVPVGEMFSPAEGDLLLHGKLQKMNGPVPDVTASSPTTTAQPHLATGLVQLTNGDFISLMWSGRKVEYLGGAMFGDSHLQKYCDIMHVWLLQFTALGNRTPRAILAKSTRLEKQYKAALKKYTRRPTLANHSHLYQFLSAPLDWQHELLRIGMGLGHTADDETDACMMAASCTLPVAAKTSPHEEIPGQPSTQRQTVLRQGKTLFSAELVDCNREKELLAKQLHIQSSKTAAYKQQVTDLSAAMTSGVRVLMQDNIALRKEQTKVRESKVGLQQRYKELRKSSVPRNIHEKVLKEVLEQNKQLQQDVGSLSLQIEARDVENERSGEKVLALQKKVNRLRMLSARKDVSMEHNKLAADVALNELRLDKEASETYHQQVLQLLQREVEMGIKTEEDLQQEIQAMKNLETKSNGIFNAQVRLLYYDLLGKGVSANIVHNVVKTVLQHATPIDADSVSLPSRSTAQRMVLEAGELVKVRTSYELLNNNGNLGHHSDGTTKSLIHWGMHVLKLDCGDKTKTFSLTVSPVPSGKAADTVNQLIEQMAELEQIAHDMGTDPGDAFSLKRVVSRMSDRANNERAVTKLLLLEKEKALAQTPGWQQMSDEDKTARTKLYDFTCASHKIDNVSNAMTDASAELLYPQSDSKRKGLLGAKKQIYEVSKLICQQSRKEYSRGRDFKMFCLDQSEDTYKGTGAHLLKPVIGNRYIVFLMNAIPTLMSKEIIMIYLEALKDSKEGAATLNRLELSVWQGYLSADIEAELCAFSLMYYFVCQPLLSRAKVAKSPLDMNYFYVTAVRRLADFEGDSSPLLNEDPEIWGGAVQETEPYRPYISHIQSIAKHDGCKEKVSAILCQMAAAGKEKLMAHASEHLPGGVYYEPTDGAIAAGNLLGTATNDIVESGFGLLDRQQTTCPTRNPVNTSAIVTAKRDKPVDFVASQDPDMQKLMVTTARKSASRKRKRVGTTDCQLLKLWQSGSEGRENRIKRRKETRDKRQKKMDAVGELIKSGRLLTDATEIGHLKSGDLLQQLQMWIHLKTIGMQVNNRDLLKGSAAAKIADKKERLRSLISTNAATIDAIVTRGTATVNSTPPSPQQQEDSASEQQSSSEEDLEDTESYHHIQDARLHTFKFTQTSEVVVVAFAGGVWYPGVVKTVVSPDTAIINYLHPTSHTVPLPESTEFRFPAKEDTMETDATSVFENNLTCEPTSTSCRTFTLSQNVSSINTRYAQFARLYNIPL